MQRDPEFFGDQELPLLYLARRLRDALRLEELLTKNEVDYLVETGDYTSGFVIKRELTGAYFYVAPVDLERSRSLLRQNRFKPVEEAETRS